MIAAIVETTTGRIRRVVSMSDPAQLALQAGAGEHIRTPVGVEVNDLSHYDDGNGVLPRPTPPAPPTILAGQATVWTGLPVDATVTIIDPETSVVAGTVTADAQGTVSLTLPVGPWRFGVAETWPALGAQYEVTISE